VNPASFLFALVFALSGQWAMAQARVMNPGEAVGQLVYLTADDVKSETPKYKSLSPLSIPVFGELPLDLAVVAGSITLKQQNLLSHVQLKSRARHTPNLDISNLPGGTGNELFKNVKDGDWVRMVLGKDGSIMLEKSSEAAATVFLQSKKLEPVTLKSDVRAKKIYTHAEIGYKDFERVGSKAANYAELIMALNTAGRTVVRPGFAIPFYYYQEFIDTNPKIKEAIEKLLTDPLMNRVARVSYREEKLKSLRELMRAEDVVVSQELVNQLIATFDPIKSNGLPRKIKLRSSTNSEDLPNFNGAGLYSSESYKPVNKEGKEKKPAKKAESMREALKEVWASVWSLRAFEERTLFRIPHADVKMGVQANLSFANEGVDGVVVTKNMADDPKLPGDGVYIESQRGDEHSVANPQANVRPERVLVLIDRKQPLNKAAYKVHVLQKSNIADDMKTILPGDNPNPVMSEDEIKDLVALSLQAEAHFRKFQNNANLALDLEFKVDSEDTGKRQVYIKQARPYID